MTKISPVELLDTYRRPLVSKVTPEGRMQSMQSAEFNLVGDSLTGALGSFAELRILMAAFRLVGACVGWPFAYVIAKSLKPSGGLRFLRYC